MSFIFSSIRLSEKTLKFNNILNKKEFRKSKHPIDLGLVSVDEIVVSDKFKHSDKGFKYFIGYKKDKIVKPLCIILPQMNGYIKYFDNGSKNMSFFIRDDEMLDKYNEIWNVIKNKLGIKFHGEPIYDKKYIKAKVREFDGVIKTNFWGNKIPKENMHYTCIVCAIIDSIVRMDKKNYLLVYLEECKYKIKKIHMPRFINAELESELELESESDAKLIANLESSYNSE